MTQIYNRPLAILPSAATAFARQFEALKPEPEASRFVGARSAGAPYRTTESGVAIIPITAPLVNRLSGMWGVMSYEYLSAILGTAAKDTSVSSIALDFDSPGGEAIGCFELAAQIRAIDKTKSVHAAINGLCCSACYAIASGAKTITATESSVVGSIGVVAVHLDASRALDRAGVTPTLIYAGEKKTLGNPLEPLSEEAHADIQREIDRFYGMFVSAVAAGRGARMSADAARKTEARTFIGAEAKAAGLIDHVGSFSDVLGRIEQDSRVASATRRLAALPTQTPIAQTQKGDDWSAVHRRMGIKTIDPGPAVETNFGWDNVVAEANERSKRRR